VKVKDMQLRAAKWESVAVFNQEQEVGTVTRQVHNPESSRTGTKVAQ